MSAPLLVDLSHTSHTRARTGIQRVARSLHVALGGDAVAITHDPHLDAWRGLEPWERANLAATSAAGKRGARWPLSARLRGWVRRLLRRAGAASGDGGARLRDNSGLLVPEIFSPGVARALPSLFTAAQGPRIALFHDAIALKFPELTPAKTVARFPPYLLELLAFDGIAAVSDDSRETLIDYWRWLGVRKTPRVQTIALGIDARPLHPNMETRPPLAARSAPVILSVGSIEGRKNHRALLEACEQLWACGETFSLHLIGLAHAQTGAAALARIRELQARGRALRYDGPVSDAALESAYAECAFTVYPSLIEGFGLPIFESVAHGKPCVCSARGAIGEAARGGGCLALERVDAPGIAGAIERLLRSPGDLALLSAQARARTFRTWADYVSDLRAWMSGL